MENEYFESKICTMRRIDDLIVTIWVSLRGDHEVVNGQSLLFNLSYKILAPPRNVFAGVTVKAYLHNFYNNGVNC